MRRSREDIRNGSAGHQRSAFPPRGIDLKQLPSCRRRQTVRRLDFTAYLWKHAGLLSRHSCSQTTITTRQVSKRGMTELWCLLVSLGIVIRQASMIQPFWPSNLAVQKQIYLLPQGSLDRLIQEQARVIGRFSDNDRNIS